MSEKMVKKDIKCRVCKNIPKDGYPLNRAVRHDWICGKCYSEYQQDYRAKLKQKHAEGKDEKS